ncbi:MAG: metalloregulator ArsR/SmtB family transcription factor [Candidatus Colwellbacteria bacterium]
MREMERVLKALANKRRLAIVKYLKKHREASVGELAGAIKLSFKSTSRHLNILTAADILDKDQRSLQVFYRLSDTLPSIAGIIIKII